jgi:hypothetical protein
MIIIITLILILLFLLNISNCNDDNFYKLKDQLNINNNYITKCSQYRGLYLPFFMPKNKTLLSIDLDNIIIHSKLLNIYNISEHLENNSLIAYHLMILENNKDPKWKLYLNSLPKDLNNFIFYYKDKQLLNYVFSNYSNDMNIYNDNAKKLYQYNKKKKFINIYTEKEFINKYFYYLTLVNSRTFTIGEDDSGLVPFADLFNHSNNSNTTWYFDSKLNKFIIKSSKLILPFEEITTDYGHPYNSELLYTYGFTIDNNDPYLDIKYNNNNYIIDKTTDFNDFIETNNIDKNDFILFLRNRYDKNNNYLEQDISHDIKNVLIDQNKMIDILLNNTNNIIN